jgi:hypothetical protein
VETENRNQKGENVKSEIIDGYNKFMKGMNRAYQILHYYPHSRQPMKWTETFYVMFATKGCHK